MQTSSLTNISPIDGRYSSETRQLSKYFSEFALFKYRVFIELKYLLFLSKINIVHKISSDEIRKIEQISNNFSIKDAEKIKKYEEFIKHDVKAVEYFLRPKLSKRLSPWIHFGLTSDDINCNAYRLMIHEGLTSIITPQLKELTKSLNIISKKYLNLPMLGRTHGQPAIPTTFGKEISVFSTRIKKEIKNLENIKLYGKFGGSIGNWNALNLAFPQKDWPQLSGQFLKELGLSQSKITTQTAPPEDIIEVFQNFIRINNILTDLTQDIWRYISDGWIIQKGKENDVGSSTMPQKINPIEFENCEGNLIIANSLFETFSRKLPISRLQRDLSDSTVLRNLGIAFAHSLIAYKSCVKGLKTLSINKEAILNELNADWSILSETLQTILRKEGKTDAYERVASQIRGKKLNKNDWINIVNSLQISKKSKSLLENLTPSTYTGIVLNKW
jgi:adenylosuccinate lyase